MPCGSNARLSPCRLFSCVTLRALRVPVIILQRHGQLCRRRDLKTIRRYNSVASSLAFGDKTSEVCQCCWKSPLLLAILRYRRLSQMEKLDRIHGIPLPPPRGGDLTNVQHNAAGALFSRLGLTANLSARLYHREKLRRDKTPKRSLAASRPASYATLQIAGRPPSHGSRSSQRRVPQTHQHPSDSRPPSGSGGNWYTMNAVRVSDRHSKFRVETF